MQHHLKRILSVLAIATAVQSASAFSLLGPFAPWEVARIGYNPLNTDIGGPMNLGEEYRWNIRTVYYGFDSSFLNYFGAQGQQAIRQAVGILNAVPPASAMSAELTEFPLNTRRVNYQASGLGLLDLKSYALAFMLEEMGPASSERYTWTLRNRSEVNQTVFYAVIRRNFDPVTWVPSSYVNGVLYTYAIQEFQQPDWADAVELQVDPLQFGFNTVISAADGLLDGFLSPGEFFTGLTRDDIGSLRYIYRQNNYNVEQLLPGTQGGGPGGGSGSPWTPWPPPGGGGTNNMVDTALRPGIDKVNFQEAQYDSLLGSFIVFTNAFSDTFVSNSTIFSQSVQRIVVQPDLVFLAEDLGVTVPTGVPVRLTRTVTDGWANNSALNGQAALDGPGVIQPQVQISFSNAGPYIINATPFLLTESRNILVGGPWGLFDGSTNTPIIFPNGLSIQMMEQMVLGR